MRIVPLLLAIALWPGLAWAAVDARAVYDQHCARCHGAEGRGNGPAHTMQRPWPRDFTRGEYKYRSTPQGVLPAVSDVTAVVRGGILRSSMPPFAKFLSDDEINAVSRFVLEFSKASGMPPGEGQEYARPIEIDVTGPDAAADAAALAHGKELFVRYKCIECHGADGRGLGQLVGTLVDSNNFWIRPADLSDPAAYAGGSKSSDVYMRVMTGLSGSPMPSFAEAAPAEDLKAIARYVKTLQVAPAERQPVAREVWQAALPAKIRGEYLTRAMSCALCHNHYDADGAYNPRAYLAGGVAIRIPGLGTFPTRNITSHQEMGIGKWTEDQIIAAVIRGVVPDRRLEAFAMPWVFFSYLTDGDARDIAVYLKTLAPISNDVPRRTYDPFWKRLGHRLLQLIGLEHGRLEYPPHNVGRMTE